MLHALGQVRSGDWGNPTAVALLALYVIGSFAARNPRVLCYTLEELLVEKLRSILQRSKTRDYYDVWRLLKEKADQFDRQSVRGVLTAKCGHKGLAAPSFADALSPTLLDAAAAALPG